MEMRRRSDSGRITIPIHIVVCGAPSGGIFSFRGLGELPDAGKINTTFSRTWRVLGKGASRRRRAGVIAHPERNLSRPCVSADVLSGDDVLAAFFCSGYPRAIYPGAETSGGYAVHPGIDVGSLLGEHAPPLLLVEEDNGSPGKAFATGRGGSGLGVGLAKSGCVGDRFQFGVETAVVEHEKTKACRFQGSAFARPGIGARAGWMVEPVSGEGESLPECFEVLVPGVVIAVEAEVSGRACCRNRSWIDSLTKGRSESTEGDQSTRRLFHEHMLVLAQMGFIPKDAKWYLAEIVEEIRVEGDQRNVVHTNLVLVRADSPDEAYEKAMALGKQGNTKYTNHKGKTVTIRFRGLKDLNVIHDELEHGSEIIFTRNVGVSDKKIKNWILPRRRLGVFAPIRPHRGPDYASAEVIEMVYERWPHLKGVRGPGHKKSRKRSK
jgi:hypothetical protein